MKVLGIGFSVVFSFCALSEGAFQKDFEQYEGGDVLKENAIIQSLAAKFALSQVAVGSRTGGNKRGTHAKGTCFTGHLEILGNAPRSVAGGAFSVRSKEPIPVPHIRFANAASKPQEDFVYDVRSVSFRVKIGDQLWDVSTNNHPSFTFSLLKDFDNFMGFALFSGSIAALPADKQLEARNAFFAKSTDVEKSVNRTLALGAVQQNKDVAHYYTESYYTGTSFLFGEGNPSKFRLDPCVEANEPVTSLKDRVRLPHQSDYKDQAQFLQTDLAQTVEKSPEKVCFYISVESLDAKKMRLPEKLAPWESVDSTLMAGETAEPWQWVEYATLNWTKALKDAKVEPLRIAKLTADQGSIKSAKDCDDAGSSLDVKTNTFEDMAALGRMNRGRGPVENQSKDMRK